MGGLFREVYFECRRKPCFLFCFVSTTALYSLMLTCLNFSTYYLLSVFESLAELIPLTPVCKNHSTVNIVHFVLGFYIIKCILKVSLSLFLQD